MANRLAGSSSPYLLQHADNPVDWWEWADDAFAEARRRDVPVLLSVGYAACHWCHVMAHESFEDDEVAAAVNAGFVAVKVDREERPDVDAVYMAATTALTGHGGWPMTCLLTPEGDPFFAGTYLPKRAAALAAGQRRRGVGAPARAGAGLGGARGGTAARGDTRPAGRRRSSTPSVCDTAVRRLRSTYDEARGGFGGAPKFPPSMVLEFLLRHHARTGSADALAMARGTVRGDGPRRDVRPARRRLRPVLRRRRLGGAALREDALRQRPAAAGVRPPLAHDRRPAGPARGRGDRRIPRCATCAPTRAGSPPRSTPTPSSRALARGPHLRVDTRPARRGARVGGRGTCGGAAGGHRRGHLRGAAPRPCSCDRPRGPRMVGDDACPAARPPARCDPSPAATTRSSRRGTAWRSQPSRMPVCC